MDASRSNERVASLMARRDAKRSQVQALGEEVIAIQRQMNGINEELRSLDDEIRQAELEFHNRNNSEETAQRIPDEETMTDEEPPTVKATQNPPMASQFAMTTEDEILTDPMTHPESTPRRDATADREAREIESFYEDSEAREIESFYEEGIVTSPPRPPSPKKSASLAGQLQITRRNTVPVSNRRHRSEESAKKKPAAATLERYFPKSSDSTPSSQQNPANYERVDLSQQDPPVIQQPPRISPQNAVASLRQDRIVTYEEQLKSDEFPWSQHVKDLSHGVFRIASFRGEQKEIINCTLNGDDAFVIMRTGGGKSLCYQLPAMLEGNGPERKITVVVSPLLSLISDQVEQMNDMAPASAIAFTSNMPGGVSEHTRRWNQVRDSASGVCLVFVTPEKVHNSGKLKSELQKLDSQGRLGRFVVDECHCACQWGHDFRPDYTKLGVLKSMFPHVPLIALTATASNRVREDVCRILRLGQNYQFFRSTANRPNLKYSVVQKKEGKEKVVDDMAAFIKEKHPHNPGIIYTLSKKDADTVADKLCDRGILAQSYHAGVNASRKDEVYKSWMSNNTQVVVATIAFGLGINKPDVRFVLHHSVSKTLEAYYQESGRAGRDGNPADCVLYYSTKDVTRMIEMIHGDNVERSFWSMVRYAQASGTDSVCRAMILSTLGEPGCADPALAEEESDGITTTSRNVGSHAKTVTELLQHKLTTGEKLTIPKLVKEWRSTSDDGPECVRRNPPGKDLNADECSRVIVAMMIEGIIDPNVIYNSKGFANMYLNLGRAAHRLLASPDPQVCVRLPLRTRKSCAQNSAAKAKAVVPDSGGWISSKKAAGTKKTTAAKRKRSAGSKEKKTRRKPKASAAKKKSDNKSNIKKPEIIDLGDSTSSDDDSVVGEGQRKNIKGGHAALLDSSSDDDPIKLPRRSSVTTKTEPDDSDSEFEFEYE